MSEIRKIILQFPSLRAFLSEYGERISAEGMLLRSEAPPAVGSRVDIEIVVAEGMRLLRARGETLWSGTGLVGGGQKAAVVRFEELDQASRTLIGRIVDQRRREGYQPFSLEDVAGTHETRPRDLTVPAAVVSAESGPAGGSVDSIFDLAAPVVAAESDLFSSASAAEPSPAAAEEAPARVREPAPPVPLLADPDPAPFDLEPDPTVGEGEGVPEPAARADLSDLFGGDEPEMTPARGRTEAFPPSFVDEVEAELEAAESTADSYLEVETGELEVHLGTSVDEPEPVAPAAVEPAFEPPQTTPEAEAALEPQAAFESEPEPEPQPEPESELPPGAESLSPEASSQLAQAFGAVPGPETVEIPIAAVPSPAAPPPVAEQPPAVGDPLQVSEPPAVEPAPPTTESPLPPVETPPATAPLDDNLLSIPEPDPGSAPVEEPSGPAVPADLPSSAESLRGAASRSQHLGTWLLIALLVIALAVAGYFLLGLVQGGEPSDPGTGVNAPPEPPAAVNDAAPDQPLAETAAAPAGDEAAPAAVEEPGPVEPVAAEPLPATPAAPLTALNRITWNESDSETVLALVGDGVIARERIELSAIGGDQPRLVMKISGVQRAFQPAVLEVGTSQVQKVRTGLHSGGELHVVIDLAAPGVSAGDLAVRGSRMELRIEGE